jgi:CBS domain containing-hemolysin-like protein
MNILTSIAQDLQGIASWLMSMLSLLAVFVSLIVGIVCVEFIFKRAALSRAYTVRTNSSDSDNPAGGR